MPKLSDLIREWEEESGFSISTLEKAREGKPVKSITARLIAKAIGKDLRSDEHDSKPDEAA
jgi:hypothetical protein